jgi:hypothetical protein
MPDLGAYSAASALISAAEAAAFHGQWLRTRAGDYSDQVRGRLLQGLAVPANAYIDALRMRDNHDFRLRVDFKMVADVAQPVGGLRKTFAEVINNLVLSQCGTRKQRCRNSYQ